MEVLKEPTKKSNTKYQTIRREVKKECKQKKRIYLEIRPEKNV